MGSAQFCGGDRWATAPVTREVEVLQLGDDLLDRRQLLCDGRHLARHRLQALLRLPLLVEEERQQGHCFTVSHMPLFPYAHLHARWCHATTGEGCW